MTKVKKILVLNGASSTDRAPNFIAIVQKQGTSYHTIIDHKTTEKGGPERFPLYFQEFIEKDFIKPAEIDLIAVIIGPGSFTGLRASIAFALGLQVGLNCSVVALRRGESLFPFLQKKHKKQEIWHATHARRGRVFIESSHTGKVIAYNDDGVIFPKTDLLLIGEAADILAPSLPANATLCKDFVGEADILMIAEVADLYCVEKRVGNGLYPLYVDPPEAKLPAKGLREAPQ